MHRVERLLDQRAWRTPDSEHTRPSTGRIPGTNGNQPSFSGVTGAAERSKDTSCTCLGHGNCHDSGMHDPATIFFNLSLEANSLGLWSMTSASGAFRYFNSRTEALEFALHEARKIHPRTPVAIRVEGADLRWRSFDDEFKPVLDEKSFLARGRRSD
ncbi:MAG: hypothetical protein ABI389_02780 [Rhodanobacter sp.]